MFERFWQSSNAWAEALSMDDPRGDYMFRLEDRVAKLERDLLQVLLTTSDSQALVMAIRVAQKDSVIAVFAAHGLKVSDSSGSSTD